MKRAGIVAVATIAGLAGVLGFHTKPARLGLGTPVGTAPPTGGTGSTAPASGGRPAAPSGPAAGAGTTSGTRTATGTAVNYNYGVLSVAATVSGTKLAKVTIASIDDGGNFRSQSIDQQSLPVLEQEALAAQGANIQGVSGASYTSAGFEQSLQSALTKLNFK
jgi:uncharacterized protein with FMN-binding domain